MDFFRFTFKVAVINLVLQFVAMVAMTALIPLYLKLKNERLVSITAYTIPIITSYFLATAAVIAAFSIENGPPSMGNGLIYFIIFSFVILTNVSMNANDFEKSTGGRALFFVPGIALYTTSVFLIGLILPKAIVSYPSLLLFKLTKWILDLPVVGWLVGFFGVGQVIQYSFISIVATVMIVKGISSKKETPDPIKEAS